jgi:structural maintenance of chromosome 4
VVKPDPEALEQKPLSRKRKAPTGRGRGRPPAAAKAAAAAETVAAETVAAASAIKTSDTPTATPADADATPSSSLLVPPSSTARRSPTPRVETDALADTTSSNINTLKASPDDAVKPIRPLDTVLERPMDIVLKARTMGPPVVEDTGPRARICITYLVLTNFKSYAGRQEVGPFHASFSSVVGPNGSGKSNVIDSLLFVFGFRASKMRQGKISALIHNSAAFPNLDYCEVAVHFQEVMDQVRECRL